MTAAIAIEGLSKTYRISVPGESGRREVLALQDIHLEAHEGEVLGIIGRNGAGKSTLLKVLSRIVTPTAGRAVVRGRVAALLEVGTGMHPEMTGRENIHLNGALLGMSRREVDAKMDAILEFAGVGPYADTPLKRYSSGMQLRIAFAVAAHLTADILIVDEVLAVGDAEFQAKCLGAVREGVQRGRTTLFVSHNMPAVESLCDRVAWLDEGRLRTVGEPSEVVGEYLRGVTSGAAAAWTAPDSPKEDLPVRVVRAELAGSGIAQGDDVVVNVDLEVREPVRGLQLSVAISTLEGLPVSTVCNGDLRGEWTLEPGLHRASCILEDARLLPRTHSVSLRTMQDWGRTTFERLDSVLSFTVAERDVRGSGVPLRADRGAVWVPAQFSVEPLDGESA